MSTKFKIGSIKKINVATKYGPKDKWIVKVDGGGEASSFIGKWNEHWKAGEIAEADIVTNESGGKKYTNLECPEHLKPAKGESNSPFVGKKLAEIELKIDEILSILNGAKEYGTSAINEDEEADSEFSPEPVDDIDISSIPF